MPKRSHTAKPTTPAWVWILLAAIVIAGAAYLLTRNTPATGLPAEISVVSAYEKYNTGTYILDVRQPDEWAAGHIPNATLIPLGELESRLSEVPTDREVVIVCRSGNRSGQARDLLKQAGFTNVTSMAGGMNLWATAGYPVVTGP
jgi:rhodanese-related sulfurtransferase